MDVIANQLANAESKRMADLQAAEDKKQAIEAENARVMLEKETARAAFEAQVQREKEEEEARRKAEEDRHADEERRAKIEYEEKAREALEKFEAEKERVRENEEYLARAAATKFWKNKLNKVEERNQELEKEKDELLAERESVLGAKAEQMRLEKEQAERVPIFEELLLKRREMVIKGVEQLESYLLAPEQLYMDFQRIHFPNLPTPNEASNQDVAELKESVADLDYVMEKLQSRADSDGLYLALKAVMTKNVWKPKQLAEQMIKGPHALKITGGKNDEITVEQLLHFLERKQILHTKAGLSFLLQRCGSSIKGGKPLKITKFTESFDQHVPTPIAIVRPGQVVRGGRRQEDEEEGYASAGGVGLEFGSTSY